MNLKHFKSITALNIDHFELVALHVALNLSVVVPLTGYNSYLSLEKYIFVTVLFTHLRKHAVYEYITHKRKFELKIDDFVFLTSVGMKFCPILSGFCSTLPKNLSRASPPWCLNVLIFFIFELCNGSIRVYNIVPSFVP